LAPAGNLYGTTDVGGGGGCTDEGCGTAFHLAKSNGKWSEKVLVRFKNVGGDFPDSGVIMDAKGNLYGTASGHALGYGIVFKLFKLTPGEIQIRRILALLKAGKASIDAPSTQFLHF
jgi:hypothetical protein